MKRNPVKGQGVCCYQLVRAESHLFDFASEAFIFSRMISFCRLDKSRGCSTERTCVILLGLSCSQVVAKLLPFLVQCGLRLFVFLVYLGALLICSIALRGFKVR